MALSQASASHTEALLPPTHIHPNTPHHPRGQVEDSLRAQSVNTLELRERCRMTSGLVERLGIKVRQPGSPPPALAPESTSPASATSCCPRVCSLVPSRPQLLTAACAAACPAAAGYRWRPGSRSACSQRRRQAAARARRRAWRTGGSKTARRRRCGGQQSEAHSREQQPGNLGRPRGQPPAPTALNQH